MKTTSSLSWTTFQSSRRLGAVECQVLAVEPTKRCLTRGCLWSRECRHLDSHPTSTGTHLRMEQSGFRRISSRLPGAKAGGRGSGQTWSSLGADRLTSAGTIQSQACLQNCIAQASADSGNMKRVEQGAKAKPKAKRASRASGARKPRPRQEDRECRHEGLVPPKAGAKAKSGASEAKLIKVRKAENVAVVLSGGNRASRRPTATPVQAYIAGCRAGSATSGNASMRSSCGTCPMCARP